MADGEIPLRGKPQKGINCYTTVEYTADSVTHYARYIFTAIGVFDPSFFVITDPVSLSFHHSTVSSTLAENP